MSISSEARSAWRIDWLDTVTEISALDWQRRNWGVPENPHYGYVECMEHYFTDLLSGESYEPLVSKGLVSFDEAFLVAELHLKLKAFSLSFAATHDAAVLPDVVWIDITETARRVRRGLLKLLTIQSERDVLLQAEPRNT